MPEQENEKLRVILCKPSERAKVTEIGEDLKSMQDAVGGMIEEYMPFYDENDPRVENVAIICDDEGKMKQKELNRAIRDEKGNIQDVIAGPFFICYAPVESEKFESLPKDLEDRFREKYDMPEMFFWGDNGLRSEKFDPKMDFDQREEVR